MRIQRDVLYVHTATERISMSTPLPPRGRGTATNPHNRFAPNRSVAEDDGWYQEAPITQGTEVRIETAKTIITRNNSPDLPFDRSIVRSIPIAAASTVASIATRGPATLIGTCRQGWTSKPN
jgi:hypothetical protein